MDPKPIMDPSNGFLEGPKETVTKAKIQNPSVISNFFCFEGRSGTCESTRNMILRLDFEGLSKGRWPGF